MRQRIESDLQVSPELQRLLDDVRKREVTEEELHEQRISFAYGNLALHNPNITKEDVRRAVNQIRLRGGDE